MKTIYFVTNDQYAFSLYKKELEQYNIHIVRLPDPVGEKKGYNIHCLIKNKIDVLQKIYPEKRILVEAKALHIPLFSWVPGFLIDCFLHIIDMNLFLHLVHTDFFLFTHALAYKDTSGIHTFLTSGKYTKSPKQKLFFLLQSLLFYTYKKRIENDAFSLSHVGDWQKLLYTILPSKNINDLVSHIILHGS